MKTRKVYMNINCMRKALATCAVLACGLFVASPVLGNIMVNPNFDSGGDNLAGYEAFAVWNQPAGPAGFSSAWALADAPITADGGGTAVFSMNTQLAVADPFWAGATQEMTIQQNFWTPDNNAAVTPTTDLYGQTITFSGTALVTEAYAAGNTGQVFIQFLDQGWNAVAYVAADVSTLGPSGAFSINAVAPAGGLNIIQVGFRNSGIEGTAGQMTVSNLSVVPEPATIGLFAISGIGILLMRRSLPSKEES